MRRHTCKCTCAHATRKILFFFSIAVAPKTWKIGVNIVQGLSKNKSQLNYTSVLCLKYLSFVIGYNSNYWVVKLIFFLQGFFFFFKCCFTSAIGKLWTSCRWEDKFQCASVGCKGETYFKKSTHLIPINSRFITRKKSFYNGIIPCCIFRTLKPELHLGTSSQARK